MSDEPIDVDCNPETLFLTLTVTPAPTDEERDALAAAFAVLVSTSPAIPTEPEQTRSRWAMAGRREAMQPVVRSAWGRRTE
jgi:hypothetical protein